MKRQYDFSKGKRGAVIVPTGKTRITIYIDTDILKNSVSGREWSRGSNDDQRSRCDTPGEGAATGHESKGTSFAGFCGRDRGERG